MNAHEDESGNVVVDVCRYERMFDQDARGPFGDNVARLERWTVNPKTRTVSAATVEERGLEFPRCHPALNGKPYRYGYSVATTGDTFPALYKHDLATGACETHELGPGRHAGEAYFVPRHGARDEDDGYLLSYVYDQGRGASELMVLDAREPTADPLARVLLPVRVPYGFHGAWVPDGWDGPSA